MHYSITGPVFQEMLIFGAAHLTVSIQSFSAPGA